MLVIKIIILLTVILNYTLQFIRNIKSDKSLSDHVSSIIAFMMQCYVIYWLYSTINNY